MGVSIYLGRGHIWHWSTEHGWEHQRAAHRTFRVGLIYAKRRVDTPRPEGPPHLVPTGLCSPSEISKMMKDSY